MDWPPSRTAILVAAISFAVFAPSVGFDFLNYDDPLFVRDNVNIAEGFSRTSLSWIIQPQLGMWNPLTWFSYVIEVSLFGSHPAVFHATNIALHSANSALVFLLFRGVSNLDGPSFVAALLFGVHPIHIEPVVWISSRKDVLSTFFVLSSLYANMLYYRSVRLYWAYVSFGLYLCACLSKPMAIATPVLMALMELKCCPRNEGGTREAIVQLYSSLKRKRLMLMIALVIGGIGYLTQKTAGATSAPAGVLPPALHIANALVGMWRYAKEWVVPMNISICYPYDASPATGLVFLGLMSFCASIYICTRLVNIASDLAFGWFWYVVSILPVSGLVQIGQHSIANRYLYLPSIGLTFISVFCGATVIRRLARSANVGAGVGRERLDADSLAALAAVEYRFGLYRNAATYCYRSRLAAMRSGNGNLLQIVDGLLQEINGVRASKLRAGGSGQ